MEGNITPIPVIEGEISGPASMDAEIAFVPSFSLEGDTVRPGSMLEGVTAHQSDGTPIVGTLVVSAIHTGTSYPEPDLGRDGDVYFQIGG